MKVITYILEWNITGKTTIGYGCIKFCFDFNDPAEYMCEFRISAFVNLEHYYEKIFYSFPSAIKRIKCLKKEMDKYMTDIAENGMRSPDDILTSLGFITITSLPITNNQ